jgi:uncharacterized OB-fold protein
MPNSVKPLPRPDDVTGAFWSSLSNDGVLRLQWCKPCARPIHYPRPVCPHCMGNELEMREHSGRGTVHAFTIVYVHPDKAFSGDLPLVVALIDLDEGGRILSNLVSVDPSASAVKIGMPVTLRCERVSDDIVLPKFTPVVAGI